MTQGIPFADDQVEEMLERMRTGESLSSIARDPRMPSIRSMMYWEDVQDERGCMITQARAQGFCIRAEKAVERAQEAEDAALGRLDFDAERWFLGKMHPKKFGDATTVKHADVDGEKLPIDDATRVTRLAALALALRDQGADAAD